MARTPLLFPVDMLSNVRYHGLRGKLKVNCGGRLLPQWFSLFCETEERDVVPVTFKYDDTSTYRDLFDDVKDFVKEIVGFLNNGK